MPAMLVVELLHVSDVEKSVKEKDLTIQEVSIKKEPEPTKEPITLKSKDDDDSNGSL